MRIFTSMIGTDKGTLVKVDTIKHMDGLWLVPKWLVSESEAVQRPAYIIRVDTLPLQELKAGSPFGDYLLQSGHIPIDVLEGRSSKGPNGQFEVVEAPEIAFPCGRA